MCCNCVITTYTLIYLLPPTPSILFVVLLVLVQVPIRRYPPTCLAQILVGIGCDTILQRRLIAMMRFRVTTLVAWVRSNAMCGAILISRTPTPWTSVRTSELFLFLVCVT